jgi:hypothetical protein
MGGPVQIPHPSDEEIIHASFRHSSMPMNIVRMLKADEDPPVEGYNPFDEIKGTPYEEYAAHFTYSQSPSRDCQDQAADHQENKDNETLAAGGALGYAAQIAAGILDPTMFIPGGTIYRGLEGAGALRTALSMGAAGGAAAALQEGALQVGQATRSPIESLTNIGTATLLSSAMAVEGFREAKRAMVAAQIATRPWGGKVEIVNQNSVP